MVANGRFPWVAVSAVVAMIIITGAVMLPSLNEGPYVVTQGKLPTLGLTRIRADNATELLAEQIVAYDPAPLFMPSAMGSSDPELLAGIRPGAVGPFADLPARFTRSAPLGFPSPVKIPLGPVEAVMRTAARGSLLALERVDEPAVNAEKIAVRVDVLAVGSGDVVLEVVLPTIGLLAAGDWQPLELMGAVTREGWVGELVITASSGSSEIDDNFRSLLRKNVLIGDRLPVGFYTFRVGR